MTFLATFLDPLPMALGLGRSSEPLTPLARAVVGGHAPPASRGSRRPALAILAAAVVLGIGGKVALTNGVAGNPFAGGTGVAQPAAAPDAVPTAKTIRPRREASLPITVDQWATVAAYYQADLRARASGVVLKVHRDIGDKVREGDLLVEIDVPESD